MLLGALSRTFEKQPIAFWICGKLIKVSSQAALLTAFDTGNGQTAALRERRCFQTHPEAAEVMRRARCQGAFIAEPHRIFQLRVTHALAVIEDQDSTAGAVPLELDANLACPGGDTVVDDVGQGRRC